MYDLVILSVNQKKESRNIPGNTNIYLEYGQRYCDIWKFMTTTIGGWYNLLADENEIAGTKICEYQGEKCKLNLDWVEQKISDDITPYKIASDYQESFSAILHYLIDKSPIKTVYVLARCQSHDKEIILGAFTPCEFLELMNQGKIHSNICYIISKAMPI